MIIFQLMSFESRKQIPPNLRKLTIKRNAFKNVFRLSLIVEQAEFSTENEKNLPCANLGSTVVLNTIHSQALIHSVEAWQSLNKKINPVGNIGSNILQLNQISEIAINSSI